MNHREAAAEELRGASSWPRLERFIEHILMDPISAAEATTAFEDAARR